MRNPRPFYTLAKMVFLLTAFARVACAEMSLKDLDKHPQVIKREAPDYPLSMKRSRMVGEVVLEFIVDTDGKVTFPRVVRSNNPNFEQPAIDAVLKWKFKPGIKNGKPVNTRMRIPIAFNLNGAGDSREAYDAPQPTKKQTAKMPEGLRYDVAPKPRSVIYPVYPYELFRDGKKGEATVGVLVTASGAVAQTTVVKETTPEFGLAALAACEYFEFEPATFKEKDTNAAITISLEFNSRSIFVTDEDRAMLRLEKKSPEKIISAKKLDAVPKFVVVRDAPFPLAARRENLDQGEAVVEFLIDTEGKVRLPRIVSSTHPSFGYIAVQTAANWRYEPPMSQGKPVVTRARVPFEFSLKDPPRARRSTARP